MRKRIFLLVLCAGMLSGADIQFDFAGDAPAGKESFSLSPAGTDRAEAFSDFAVFVNGILTASDDEKKIPEPLLDKLYLAAEKTPDSEELLELVKGDLEEQKKPLPPRTMRLIKFAQEHPEHTQLGLLLASNLMLYALAGDTELTAEVVRLMNSLKPRTAKFPADSREAKAMFAGRILLASLLASQKKYDEADKEISELLETASAEQRLQLLPLAVNVYLDARENSSDETPFLIGLFMKSDKEKFGRKFERLFDEVVSALADPATALDPSKYISYTSAIGNRKMAEAALPLLTAPLFANPDRIDSLRRLAAFYTITGQPALAARTWLKIKDLSGGKLGRTESALLAHSLYGGCFYREAASAFAEHLKAFPEDHALKPVYARAVWGSQDFAKFPEVVAAIKNPEPELLHFSSLALSLQKRYAEALGLQLKYIESLPDPEDKEEEKTFEAALMYAVLLSEKTGRVDIAENFLLPALEEEPENAEYLNLLGYIYAEAGVKTEQALELLTRALRVQPEEPAILDSMAWALYRAKDYSRAWEFIEKAMKKTGKGPVDPVILDHAGDIRLMLDDEKGALRFWKRALENYSIELDTDKVLEKIRNAEK